MILDSQLIMSDSQAITATAASTNIIDTSGVATTVGVGAGEPLYLFVYIPASFNTLTSLTMVFQTDDNTAFSSAATIDTRSVVLATLVAGYSYVVVLPPTGIERYVRMNYTVVGTNPTTGSVFAAIVKNIQATQPIPYAY